MLDKWEELKTFLTQELNKVKSKNQSELEAVEIGAALNMMEVLAKMKEMEKEVQEKGGF